MRKLPLGLQISVAVHAVAITWLVSHIPEERKPPPKPPAIELVDSAPEPVDVTFLDPPATAAIAEVTPEQLAMAAEAARRDLEPDAALPERDTEAPAIAAIDPSRRDPAIATGTGTTGASTEPSTGTTPGKKNPLMDMRKGAPVRLTVGVPTGRWDGRETAPDSFGPDIDSGRLAPDGGGTYRSDEGPFTAKVARDGGVTFKDKKNFRIKFALPNPKQFGRMIGDWYQDPNKPVGMLPPEKIVKQPVLNNGEHSGHVDRKPDHGEVAGIPIISGGFDITDAFMRNKGIDPYASKKLEFLDATRDQRVQIGNRHRQKQLQQAAVIMKGNLDRVWSLPSPTARRQALFELWDECAETGTEDLVVAGRAARSLVIGTIRSRLPADSADAFTATEIAAFNRRKQSKAPFAPYE